MGMGAGDDSGPSADMTSDGFPIPADHPNDARDFMSQAEVGRLLLNAGYVWTVGFKTGLTENGLPPMFHFRCVRELTPRFCYPEGQRFQAETSSPVDAVRDVATGLAGRGKCPPPRVPGARPRRNARRSVADTACSA
jgi:hypothetical protein